jgi:uncharacterized protein (DUF1778 family)
LWRFATFYVNINFGGEAMTTVEDIKQEARLNVRLPLHVKERVEQAAIISGLTVTDFAIHVLGNSADEIIERHNTRTLSDRDRDLFLKMLDNPPKPNEALRKAATRYNEVVKG